MAHEQKTLSLGSNIVNKKEFEETATYSLNTP